ncbi:uncharacterized protein LOC123562946 [Mercenaria mercenaria]|uniref:uncharacterized protein LOC123562946 n=1 Tax=Mercenaria mercenaria TaxID=6596 RepID=UPI00234E96D4|nr:uncharacterized protein LOC123562946 [Mercenaria mercenaria]
MPLDFSSLKQFVSERMFNKYMCNSLILLATCLGALSERQGNNICAAGGRCNSLEDCRCGEQCIDVSDLKPCHSKLCQCLPGCVVGEIFIPPGVTRPDTYCNSCGCPSRPGSGTGMWCTLAAWCNLPQNVSLFKENPACHEQQDEQTQE